MFERGVESLGWDGTGKTKFGCLFSAFQVIDFAAVDEVLLLCFGVGFPLGLELL